MEIAICVVVILFIEFKVSKSLGDYSLLVPENHGWIALTIVVIESGNGVVASTGYLLSSLISDIDHGCDLRQRGGIVDDGSPRGASSPAEVPVLQPKAGKRRDYLLHSGEGR